jgi:hypothetical protein
VESLERFLVDNDFLLQLCLVMLNIDAHIRIWMIISIFNFLYARMKNICTMLDPMSILDWCKDMPYKHYVHKIINVPNDYILATGL